MNKTVLSSLTETERMLVADTERAAIADRSEDELLELHTRVRRARGKYVKNYRRGASARVESAGGRGKGYAQSSRDRGKAEVFEVALARVSREVAIRANQSAADLKAERLAAARQDSAAPRVDTTDAGLPGPAGRDQAPRKTTGGIKKDASSRAMGTRRQAARDAR